MATYKAKFIAEHFSYTENIDGESLEDAVANAKLRLSMLQKEDVMPSNSMLWEILDNENHSKKLWNALWHNRLNEL